MITGADSEWGKMTIFNFIFLFHFLYRQQKIKAKGFCIRISRTLRNLISPVIIHIQHADKCEAKSCLIFWSRFCDFSTAIHKYDNQSYNLNFSLRFFSIFSIEISNKVLFSLYLDAIRNVVGIWAARVAIKFMLINFWFVSKRACRNK